MHKLFTLVIVLVAYATSASADDKLQNIALVVENMQYVSFCDLNYTSKVERSYPTLTVTFEAIEPASDTSKVSIVQKLTSRLLRRFYTAKLCNCIKSYMAEGVGSEPTASAKCISTPNSFKIVYKGAYDPAKDILPPLKKLASAISGYDAPELGGWVCTQKVYESPSGWVSIKVKTPFDGTQGIAYTDVCGDILEYLIQGDFLAKSKNKCSEVNGEVVVDLWADE